MIINRISGTDVIIEKYAKLTEGASHIRIDALRLRLKVFLESVEKKSHGWEETALRLFKIVFHSVDVTRTLLTYRGTFDKPTGQHVKCVTQFTMSERHLSKYRIPEKELMAKIQVLNESDLANVSALMELTMSTCFNLTHGATFPIPDILISEYRKVAA